jgi:hypothetical protein
MDCGKKCYTRAVAGYNASNEKNHRGRACARHAAGHHVNLRKHGARDGAAIGVAGLTQARPWHGVIG